MEDLIVVFVEVSRFCLCMLIWGWLFTGAGWLSSAVAASDSGQGAADLQEAPPENINAVLEKRDELAHDSRKRSLFPEFYNKQSKQRHDWWQKSGVDFALNYDVISQAFNDRDISLGGTAGDLTMSGRWLIWEERNKEPFSLNFRFRYRSAYSAYSPSDIQSNTDLQWGTVKGFNDSGFQVPNLYFDQRLYNNELALFYGQFPIDFFVDKHVMRSAKRFFLNKAFSDNPTINFPSYGAGFAMHWKPAKGWELTGGGSNIQGTEADKVVSFSLGSTALFGTIQAVYNFNGVDDRGGRLQIMGWGSDENKEDEYNAGSGFSLTLEHGGIANTETFVLRLAQSSGESTNTDTMVFLAYGKEIRNFDSLGFGVSAGRSSKNSEWQTVFETYYRWQLSKELVVTPDLQIIFGDDDEGNGKTRVVGGIRLGIVF